MKASNRAAVALLLGAALAATPLAAPRSANGGVKVGVLTCDTVPGTRVDLLIHSNVQVECIFATPEGVEHYEGETGIGLGIDLSWNRQEEFTFAVLMAASDVRVGYHALSGAYMGGSGSAALGLGVGAGVLIGGGSNNVSLQPLGVEGSSGVGIAGGLSYLFLRPKKQAEQTEQTE